MTTTFHSELILEYLILKILRVHLWVTMTTTFNGLLIIERLNLKCIESNHSMGCYDENIS